VAEPVDAAQDAAVASVLRSLAMEWTEFEGRLEATPLIRKLTRGRFELADYRMFLINLRQQVKEGSLWMARAASSIDEDHLELRSTLMRHAVTEHRDFRMLETDYVAGGGTLEDIRNAQKNIGSEALSAWMFHQASQPNPFDLLGAMFIIEGLGHQGRGMGAPGAKPARPVAGCREFPALSWRERCRAQGRVRPDAAHGASG
jgi:hypothetical protein